MQVRIRQLCFRQRDAIEHHTAGMLASKRVPAFRAGYEQVQKVLSANQIDPLIGVWEERMEIIENEGL